MKKIKIGMISLGCAKNQVDAEVMLAMLDAAGYELTNDAKKADIIIINTCGFIDDAKQEAIDTIIETGKLKEKKLKGIIVSGCLAQRYGKQIVQTLPEVNAVVGAYDFGNIVEAVEAVLKQEHIVRGTGLAKAKLKRPNGDIYYFSDNVDLSLDYLDFGRILTTPKSYAYLKVAEGCSNRCTYCAIPGIRGPFRSRTIDSLRAEALNLAASGIKEIVVVAQDTTMYGTDISADGKSMLPELIGMLDGIDEIQRVRLLYLYPDEVTEEILNAIKNSKKTLHYFDIPLQHINDRVLKRMNRRGNGAMYKKVIADFRAAMPDCVIRTSLITGFPGETNEEYLEMLDFLKETKLDRVGIFIYSKEEGTPAAKLPDQVPMTVKKRRYNELMRTQQAISYGKNIQRIGKVYDVIVDSFSNDGLFYKGRSYMEAPEEDGTIYFAAHDELSAGDIVKVKILQAEEYDLTGEQI